MNKKILSLLLIIVLSLSLFGCEQIPAEEDLLGERDSQDVEIEKQDEVVEEDTYSSHEEVAEYIHKYGKLPSNYITKKEAIDLGWKNKEGNLWDVTDKKSIGGDRFGNREGKLPNKDGRLWFECDVNYQGGYRGSERLVYSNDGLIYYTDDHYKTFTQLY